MQDVPGQNETSLPRSPHYWELKKILDDAGVLLVPTDRDLAPYDHSQDIDGGEADGGSGQRSAGA